MKIIPYIVFLVVLSSMCIAEEVTFDEDNWNNEVSDQKQIDLAIEKGKVVTAEQFSLASLASQESYVLSTNADFADTNQRGVFKRLASVDGFNFQKNRENTIKYLRIVDDFRDKEDKDIFERAVSQDISIVNKNKDVFLVYALSNDITFVPTELIGRFESFNKDTGEFVTEGKFSTIFTFDHIMAMQGKGFSSFGIGEGGELTYDANNNMVVIQNGDFRILDGDVIITQGTIKTDYFESGVNIPHGCDECLAKVLEGGEIFVSGKDFALPSGDILVRGSAVLYNQEHIMYHGNSEFIETYEARPSIRYTITADTDYAKSCADSEISCIERDNDFLKVIARGENEIVIRDFDFRINFLAAPIISDGSDVVYLTSEGHGIILSEEPYKIIGDPINLPKIACGFVNDKGGACYNFVGSTTQECGKDLGFLISKNAREIHGAYIDALNKNKVGTHYGSKSIYAWLMAQSPSSGNDPSYNEWASTKGSNADKGGYGLTHQQALLVVLLTEKNPGTIGVSIQDAVNEAREASLTTFEEVFAYVDHRYGSYNAVTDTFGLGISQAATRARESEIPEQAVSQLPIH